jgi:hypothetical protein
LFKTAGKTNLPKEINYEHNYRVNEDGDIVHDKGADAKKSADPMIACLERITLALQGIDCSLDELLTDKKHESRDKKNLALLNGLPFEETGSERID